MKTTLMLAALLAFASMAQAGPPMTPAKTKAPLHLSQVKSIFHRSEPIASVQQTSVPAQKAAAGVPSAGGATSTATAEPITSPVSKKVHVRTFLNHPITAPGPK